jgi:hypothetical protein
LTLNLLAGVRISSCVAKQLIMNITTKHEKDQLVYLIGSIDKKKITGISITVDGYGLKIHYKFADNGAPVPENEVFGSRQEVLDYWAEKIKE